MRESTANKIDFVSSEQIVPAVVARVPHVVPIHHRPALQSPLRSFTVAGLLPIGI